MELIEKVYLTSAAYVNLENALDPLRATIAKLNPEVDAMAKERNTIILDLDSYRRRLKAAIEKRETLESQGKGNKPAFAENEAEIAKFEAKERNTKEHYEQKNALGKQQIIEAKAIHDKVLSDAFITTVVCQVRTLEIFSLPKLLINSSMCCSMSSILALRMSSMRSFLCSRRTRSRPSGMR